MAEGAEAYDALESVIDFYGQRILEAMANFPQLKKHYGADLVRDFGMDGVRLLMRLKRIPPVEPEEELELDGSDGSDGDEPVFVGGMSPSAAGPSESLPQETML